MSEKLTVAVVLSLLGSVFVIVAGLLVAVVARVGVGVVGLMCGIFMIAGAIMMSSGEPGQVEVVNTDTSVFNTKLALCGRWILCGIYS
ncbi:MAG: hypothetical protein QW182_06150 [Thermosphaera sp.]